MIMGAGAHMLTGRSGAMSADGNLRPKLSHTRHTQEYEYETFNVHQRTCDPPLAPSPSPPEAISLQLTPSREQALRQPVP